MNLVKLSHYVIGSGTLALVSLGIVNASEAATLGGQLFSTGGNVEVEVLPFEARFTSTLFLLDPNQGGARRDLVTNRDPVGTVANVGNFTSGDELTFGIYVHETGHTFLLGPNWRNPDRFAHAIVDFLETGVLNVKIENEYIDKTANVVFEDLPRGGDVDYDDSVFQFRGKIAPEPPTSVPVPEPGMFGGVTAIGLGAFLKRKLSQKN